MNKLPSVDKPYILGASLESPIYMKVVTTDGDVLTFQLSSVDEMRFVWRYLEYWIDQQQWPTKDRKEQEIVAWRIVYTGLSPAQAAVLDTHHDSAKHTLRPIR